MTHKKWTKAEDKLIAHLNKTGMRYDKRVEFFEERTQDAIRNRSYIVRKMQSNNWIDELRVGFIDIETSDLRANFGYMISWAIKERGGESQFDVIKRNEAINPNKLDKRILKSLVAAMREYDLLIGYYSGDWRFDIPFIRSRCMYWEQDFPKQGEVFIFDLYPSVKAKMKLHRNSLDAATRFLHIEGKNHVDGDIWMRARLGDAEALEYVINHNVEDVKITEDLFERLLPYISIRRSSL